MKNEECLASVDSVDSVDNIVYLQNSSNQDSINLNFRSKLIGGLNEEDVKKYISAIEDKYQQTEQEMNELISSRNVLQEELAICKTTNMEEKRSLLESLEMAQNDLAAYVDECKKKDLTLQALSDEKNSKIAQLQIEIKQMAKKQTELEKLLSVSNQEFEQIMESASGFEQENNSLKSKIADLEKEILSNNTQDAEINKIVRVLEEQIEFEKARNEKISLDLERAQNDLVIHIEECDKKELALQALSNEKNSETAQLHNQIKQMAEKQAELEKRLSVSGLESEQIMERTAGFEQENNILKSKIADSEKELEIQRKISEKAEQELKLEKARSSNYKINGFKDEMVNIYQQLEHLTAEQVNINNELQQQLELEQMRIKKMEDLTEEQVNFIKELQQQLEAEQLRTNKAENGLAELIMWVSGLKDKLCSEQNLFETKIKHLAERHDQFQSEISNCFLSLEEFSNI
jgi:chromosome segregation ATPase